MVLSIVGKSLKLYSGQDSKISEIQINPDIKLENCKIRGT